MATEKVMGRVICDAKVENAIDAARARSGEIDASAIRSLQIKDALVDTGASTLALPGSMLRQLGLTVPISTRRFRNTTGIHEAKTFGPVRLTVLDRDITLDVFEVSEDCPVLIGQIPLEHLQLVVDMSTHRLLPSPANGGQWVMDMF